MPRGIEKVSENVHFYRGLSNSVILETKDGLLVIDPAASWDAKARHEAVRSVTHQRLNTAIYTHGHNDHTFGVPEYVSEAKEKNWPLPKVIAHAATLERFNRYRQTLNWNAIINRRQFRGGLGEPSMEANIYLPDITYTDHMTIRVGGVPAQLHHAKGETDDATWVFFPDSRLLCTGDLFIWAVPNVGNPQKVQRYVSEWVQALREMAALQPDMLLPGHGVPIIGPERVMAALLDTADLLESLHDQTLHLMNTGAPLDTIIHSVKAPDYLLEKPYLHPAYDDPEFIVRNIWRRYGGWYDGVPSHLKPAPEKALALEIAGLAGGAANLASGAKDLLEGGDLRLACHLAEWAHCSAPGDGTISEIASRVFTALAQSESSTMAMGIYLDAARQAGGHPEETMPGKTVMHAQDQRAKKG
jgi:alkyl sulfatase BDS1-like metallo-beta-lactamase superfamily hydrolase